MGEVACKFPPSTPSLPSVQVGSGSCGSCMPETRAPPTWKPTKEPTCRRWARKASILGRPWQVGPLLVLGSAFVLFLNFFVGFFGPWALTPLVDWAHLDFSCFMHFSPYFLSNLPACINFTNTRGKRLEINPTSMLILPFCPFYAGVDGVELSFNSCQLAPHN